MALRTEIPTIDIGPLSGGSERGATGLDDGARAVAEQLVAACEQPGVFQVVGHGIAAGLREQLEDSAREFFALEAEEKARIAMPLAGRAWRGWFPLGGELTSGRPDVKEGVYFGAELAPDDPRVLAGRPLHGPNLFPARPASLRPLVLEWMAEATRVGHDVLRGIAVGLDLAPDWFDSWCADPTVLFRIFHYPATRPADDHAPGSGDGGRWGVGEHTDYGLLTLLAQDSTGGLEVLVDDRWEPVEPIADALVCNLGDMLERLSGGRFIATPHRVVSPSSDRISMPLFLDPGWDVQVGALPGTEQVRRRDRRWDDEDVHLVDGPYSAYLVGRVARVFPDLFAEVGGSPPMSPNGDGHV